ncbi:MFS transporter, partial [Streptomyces sp. T-3]|nr:MFS transporter [Streptomyces sp. T-3]
DYDSSTPIALYVIAAAVLTLIAVGVAKETRQRDLSDVAADRSEPADERSAHRPKDARAV